MTEVKGTGRRRPKLSRGSGPGQNMVQDLLKAGCHLANGSNNSPRISPHNLAPLGGSLEVRQNAVLSDVRLIRFLFYGGHPGSPTIPSLLQVRQDSPLVADSLEFPANFAQFVESTKSAVPSGKLYVFCDPTNTNTFSFTASTKILKNARNFLRLSKFSPKFPTIPIGRQPI